MSGVDDRTNHWDRIYAASPSTGLSWYEREPTTSMRLIDATDVGTSAVVIDLGAGTSVLVDHLVESGYTDVTVLDVSGRALDEVRQRLGAKSDAVTYLRRDVLSWEPDRHYDVWHDRAVFHFLTDPEDRDRYVEVATGAVRPGGWVVIATFADDGPTQCSGLPVARYSPERLAGVFSAQFSLVEEDREEHVTPAGVVQPFTWVLMRRT